MPFEYSRWNLNDPIKSGSTYEFCVEHFEVSW
jgi:hypothetical protein